jgi:hypothetical protein
MIMTLAATFLQGVLIPIAAAAPCRCRTRSSPGSAMPGRQRPASLTGSSCGRRWSSCTGRRSRASFAQRPALPAAPVASCRRQRSIGERATASARPLQANARLSIGTPSRLDRRRRPGGTSILGGSGTYAGTIPGAILLVTITALITVVNASAGWRNILFGSLILGLLLLSGREAVRR